MPQSLSHVILHVVFGTRYRVPCLVKPIRSSLLPYMATIVRDAGSECYRAGGVEDHVHLAVRLNRTKTIADLVQGIKAGSSKWLKTQAPQFRDFSWQGGYAAFSVTYKGLDQLISYIDGQEAHHAGTRSGKWIRTFEDEYRALMREHGVEYDERYIWD
jgi:REP element-mobilizing transposase RayT